MSSTTQISRRAFTVAGSLVLAESCLGLRRQHALLAGEDPAAPRLRVGLMTDMHYADKKPAGTRHYRETLGKLERSAKQFSKDDLDMAIELGDFVDAAADTETELGYLRTIDQRFRQLSDQRHYVLGNHCVDTLTKGEFLGQVGRERSYYSFDAAGYHFVILDACFRSDAQPYGRHNFVWTDANIPTEELRWLRDDLGKTDLRTIACIHQRLDTEGPHGVKNAPAVRKVLEDSERVLAVLQGHSHQNEHNETAGIHYVTLAAMVEGSGPENNAYATMDLFDDHVVRITGYCRQKSYRIH